MWNDHEIGTRPKEVKHFILPGLGALELNCEQLIDTGQAHSLLVHTAVPGSESYETASAVRHRTTATPLTPATAPRGADEWVKAPGAARSFWASSAVRRSVSAACSAS